MTSAFNLPKARGFTSLIELITQLQLHSQAIANLYNIPITAVQEFTQRIQHEASVSTAELDTYPYCFVPFEALNLPIYYISGSPYVHVDHIAYMLMVACKVIQNSKWGFVTRPPEVTKIWTTSNLVLNFYHGRETNSYMVFGLRLNIVALKKQGVTITHETIAWLQSLYLEGLNALPLDI